MVWACMRDTETDLCLGEILSKARALLFELVKPCFVCRAVGRVELQACMSLCDTVTGSLTLVRIREIKDAQPPFGVQSRKAKVTRTSGRQCMCSVSSPPMTLSADLTLLSAQKRPSPRCTSAPIILGRSVTHTQTHILVHICLHINTHQALTHVRSLSKKPRCSASKARTTEKSWKRSLSCLRKSFTAG